MNKNIIISVIVAIIVLTGLLWWGRPNQKPAQSETVNTENTEAKSVLVASEKLYDFGTISMKNGDVIKEFTVTGVNFSFSPSTITVKKGDKVKITFINGGGFHDWKIDALNVATKQIQGGAQEVLEFTANTVGSFEYYCSVGQHRAMGMKGTLTVTE